MSILSWLRSLLKPPKASDRTPKSEGELNASRRKQNNIDLLQNSQMKGRTRLKIEAISTPDWMDSDAFSLTHSVLATLGFEYAGAFLAAGIPDSQACLFINRRTSVYVQYREEPDDELPIQISFQSQYADGKVFTDNYRHALPAQLSVEIPENFAKHLDDRSRKRHGMLVTPVDSAGIIAGWEERDVQCAVRFSWPRPPAASGGDLDTAVNKILERVPIKDAVAEIVAKIVTIRGQMIVPDVKAGWTAARWVAEQLSHEFGVDDIQVSVNGKEETMRFPPAVTATEAVPVNQKPFSLKMTFDKLLAYEEAREIEFAVARAFRVPPFVTWQYRVTPEIPVQMLEPETYEERQRAYLASSVMTTASVEGSLDAAISDGEAIKLVGTAGFQIWSEMEGEAAQPEALMTLTVGDQERVIKHGRYQMGTRTGEARAPRRREEWLRDVLDAWVEAINASQRRKTDPGDLAPSMTMIDADGGPINSIRLPNIGQVGEAGMQEYLRNYLRPRTEVAAYIVTFTHPEDTRVMIVGGTKEISLGQLFDKEWNASGGLDHLQRRKGAEGWIRWDKLFGDLLPP